MAGGSVTRSGASLLSQADGDHFHDSTSDRAGEVGVRFYAVDHNNSVGRQRSFAEKHLHTVIGDADSPSIHLCFDRDTHRFRSDSVLRQNFLLSFRSCASVTTHRRHDKRPCSGFLENADHGRDNLAQIGDASAAHANRDSGTRLQLDKNVLRDKLTREFGRKIPNR